ncbi:MAG: metallophosphoesterase [Caulobacter sp.]|nr:metallophosphoesterase [Caulobacter sp.]
MRIVKRFAVLAVFAVAPGLAHAAPPAPVSYVLVGPDGARLARTLTAAPDCPAIVLDGRPAPMTVRAVARTSPLRKSVFNPETKPSVFSETVCEAPVPASVRRASIAGARLPLPPARITRIVVIGDTGCRLKANPAGGGEFQACNSKDAYPFARVAASAAAWKPQLVVHVGDYHYRENACPADNAGCAGSVWGYGGDAWMADFFEPGAPLLRAAPLALVRGNHESCSRGGQGWMRYLDVAPFSAARSCDDPANDAVADYSDPFAVPLGGGAQLIMFDSSNAPAGVMPAGDIRLKHYSDNFVAMRALAAHAPYSILVDHHPLLNLGAYAGPDGKVSVVGGNAGLQQAFGPFSPTFVPSGVKLVLSGHVHLWEATSFNGAFPGQFVAGFSGTQEEAVPLPRAVPPGFMTAPGALVDTFSSWSVGFGFMTMTRAGPDRWRVEVRDLDGKVVNRCRVAGSEISCRIGYVPPYAAKAPADD